jgi:proline dehydrogenase
MAASRLIDPVRGRVASAYTAGPRLDDVIAVCKSLATYGVTSAIGYWGDPDESARAVADVHLAAINRLSAEQMDCYVSIKLSRLGFDAGLFAELASAATRSNVRLHVDALGPESVDATLRLLEGVPRTGRLGTTLPGRWHRSVDDTARIIELGLAVRVVKGQWLDDGPKRIDPSEGFLGIVDRLSGHQGGVAVATHDVRLLTESLRHLTESGTPCESELFFGLPFRGPAIAAWRLGVPVRVYVAYGASGPPFSVKELRRKPVAWWWFMQDVLLGKDKMWRSVRRARPQL